MNFVFVVLCAAAFVTAAIGVKNGVDVLSEAVTTSDAIKCLHNKAAHNEDNIDYKFLNIRMSNTSGLIQSGLDTLLNAQGTISPINALVEICPKKFDFYTQCIVDHVLKTIRDSDKSHPLDHIQYVFMSATQNAGNTAEDCWYTSGSTDDVKKNNDALDAGKNAIKSLGKFFGVKTNKQNWTLLTNDWNGISHDGGRLWWVSEGPATFDGYEAFGGWSGTPEIRQYQMGATKCNTSVNLNIGRDDFICAALEYDCDSSADCCSKSKCVNNICKYCWNKNEQCHEPMNTCCPGLTCTPDLDNLSFCQ